MSAEGSAKSPDEHGVSSSQTVTCWLLDTRPLWPGTNIKSAEGAAAAIALLSTQDQNTVRTKMFIADAKMSLGSALLKRLYISKTLGIPWSQVKLGRRDDPQSGKPCAVDKDGNIIEDIDFNTSHQAGLVTLIGLDRRRCRKDNSGGKAEEHAGQDAYVGTDIVCVNERNDYKTIDQMGMDMFVDVYDIVFSDNERWSMKYDCDYVTLTDGTILDQEVLGRNDRILARNKDVEVKTKEGKTITFKSDRIIEAKLRRFFTYFCYKEAYIKLAGEALLAPWLKQLEFYNVRSPKPGTVRGCWGEIVTDVDVQLHGKKVEGVQMNIQAFEDKFMIAASIQGKDTRDVDIPGFDLVDLQADIMAYVDGQSK